MNKHVKMNPVLMEKSKNDFMDENGNCWSHIIKDEDGDYVFFGDYMTGNYEDAGFDRFRFQIDGVLRRFSWSQIREFAETILDLAKQYGGND